MKNLIVGITGAALAVTVSAHGNITSPPARLPGPGMVKACGQSAVNNVLSDGTIPLEDVLNALPSCQLDLCRGAVFSDNVNQVQTFKAGQVVPMKAEIPIPHEGPMNVSIIKTSTNTALGKALISFDSYADENVKPLPANNTAFSVTMPTNLAATDCAQAGDCVLQWFWFGTNAKQTYESCVDFVMASENAANVSSGSTTTALNSTGAATTSSASTGVQGGAVLTSTSPLASKSTAGTNSGAGNTTSTKSGAGTTTNTGLVPVTSSPVPSSGSSLRSTPFGSLLRALKMLQARLL